MRNGCVDQGQERLLRLSLVVQDFVGHVDDLDQELLGTLVMVVLVVDPVYFQEDELIGI